MKTLKFKKKEVIDLFGSATETARVLNSHISTISCWPDTLSHGVCLKVIGAAKLARVKIPKEWIK